MLSGMSFQWASLHSITFFDTVVRSGSVSMPDHAWTTNSVFTIAVFFVLLLMSRRISSILGKKNSFRCVAVCLSAGVICLVAKSLLPASPASLAYIGNALIACGTSPLIILWGEMYQYLNPKDEQLFVTLGAIVLSVGIYLVEIQLPLVAALAVFSALPFASLASLRKAYVLLDGTSSSWGVKSKSAMRFKEKSPALFFVCIVAFSIPYNYLRTRGDLQAVLASAGDWSSVLALVIVLMVLAALAEYAGERQGLLLMPTLVLFLLSVAMAAHLLSGATPTLVVAVFLYSGYYLFLAMVYLALGPLVATTDVNKMGLFAGAMVANVAGLLLGSLLGSIDLLVGEETAALVVMIVTYAIFLAGCILLYQRSYSIFRVNFYDETLYSFEYLVPMKPVVVLSKNDDGNTAPLGGMESLLGAISSQCDAVRELHGLSSREYEVLVSLVRGLTIDSIAKEMFISKNTVKAHTKAIYRKLEVHSREELLGRVQDFEPVRGSCAEGGDGAAMA